MVSMNDVDSTTVKRKKTHCLFLAINRQWIRQATMRMEEASFTLNEVSWELVVPNLSEDRRSVRRVIVGVGL